MKQLPIFFSLSYLPTRFQDIIVDNSKTYSSSNQYAKFDDTPSMVVMDITIIKIETESRFNNFPTAVQHLP